MSKQKALKNFTLAKPVELNLVKGFPKTLKSVIKEEKLDGFRGFAIVRKGKAKLYTSGGVLVVNGPRIIKAFEIMAISKLPQLGRLFKNRCYDGEFFVRNWNDTGSIVKRQKPDHPKRKELCFRIFDTISLEEWDARKGVDKLRRRKVNLVIFETVAKQWLDKKCSNAVPVIIGKRMKATVVNAEKFLKWCLKRKHEGCVFKNPESVYPFKKHRDYGYKLKPFQESDLKVIDHKMGNGKNSHHTGSMMCVGYFDGKKIKVQVGGGLKDTDRDLFYKLFKKKKLIGTIIEMKHEGLTAKGSLRFPRFHRIRDKFDKPSLK